MKYAITGHTKNIGKFIYESLCPNIIGFSRSNGYDIRDKSIRKKIIQESRNCDVFVNNAPAGFSQSELCLELWREWKNLPKVIINVGSRIAEDNVILPISRENLLEYRMNKKILKILSEDLINMNSKVQVKYKWFGYVGTPEILAKYPEFSNNDYISIQEAAEIILK